MEKLAERAIQRRKKRVIAGLAILFAPAIFLSILWMCGNNKFKALPILGPESHKIPTDFSLTDQLGRTFNADSLKGKIHIADFIFTTCPGICPSMTKNLMDVHDKIKESYSDVRMLSISVKPEEDSVPALKLFAERFKADPQYWRFLTGEKNQIVHLIQKGYLLPLDTSGSGAEKGITHSEMAVLVDKEMRIRGFFDATKPKEVKALLDAIKILKYEYKHPENIVHE